MTCYSGFGNIADGNHPIWIGDFNGNGRADVLFYYSGDHNWWLGSHNGTVLDWSFVGNTANFGSFTDGRLVWVADFNADGKADILFYFPGDDNWWLGTMVGGQFQWSFVGNTAGFGHGINDGRPFWIGNFKRQDRAEVLFYFPGDDNWWLGSYDGNQLAWSHAGNTAGFGHGINDGRPFWIGDFNGNGRSDVLFYFPGDDNWWLGSHDGNQLAWSHVGNTAGFGHGINDGRPFWIGNFKRQDRAEVLFYFPGDDNWWLGSYDGNQLAWSHAGNTAGFGHGINDGRPFWIGDFNGNGRSDVLFYFPGDDNWWLGSHDGNQLAWSHVGNTAGFGHGINDGRPFWFGNFTRRDRAEVLFYFPGDGNWWLGSHNGTQLAWSFVGNTGRPCSQSVVIHFKSLVPITNAINNFIAIQFDAMERLFSEGGIACYYGTTEDLSGNVNLTPLQSFNVGPCLMGQPVADHNTLFAFRNNAGANDIVVYIVQTILGGSGNLLGCATHPTGQPGAVVVDDIARWLVAHEVGHVLDLRHVSTTPATNSDFLMFPNVGWTNLPPNLQQSEYTTILNSTFTNNC